MSFGYITRGGTILSGDSAYYIVQSTAAKARKIITNNSCNILLRYSSSSSSLLGKSSQRSCSILPSSSSRRLLLSTNNNKRGIFVSKTTLFSHSVIIRSMSSSSDVAPSSSTTPPISCVMLNAARLDYDGRISFDKLESVCGNATTTGDNDTNSNTVIRYEKSTGVDEVVDRVKDCSVIVNKEMPITGEMIERFSSSVKLIAEAGTGYNNIDLNACHDRGIAVCNVPTYATEAMAHMSITFIMALSCSLVPQAKAFAKNDKSYLQQCHLGSLPHFELTDKRLGLIGGLGTIGLRVAAMAQALGMEVVASSTSVPITGKKRDEDGILVVSLDELYRTSDFVSVHCPLNDQTKGLVDADAISLMKPTSYVINTARGSIIDQDALVDALRSKRIAGAALDVFGEGSAPPPALPEDSPLYELDNVILTPHIGWQRLESRQRVVDTCAENIANFFSGDGSESTNVIDTKTGRPMIRRRCK